MALALCAAGITTARAATAVALQPALLEVSVNGQPATDPAPALRDPDGHIYLPEDLLRQWHIRFDALPAVERDGRRFIALADIVGVVARFDAEAQSLVLQVRPDRLEETIVSYRPVDPGPMTPSGWGGFLNYDLLAEHGGGASRLSGSTELGIFSPHGFGTSSFLGLWSDEGASLIRLDTNWTMDDPDRMRSLRIGDSVSRGGIGGGPLRFGGIQFARNFATQPGYITMPLPSLNGSAALPSVVDVYVNNVLQSQREVRPGPFRVLDVPVVSGNGQVQLVVRDLLGRETVMSESYYAAPHLLRKGLSDYSFEAGFLREDFGRVSNAYGPAFAAGTFRYGLSDRLTVEAHVEATRDVQAGGVSATYLLPYVGVLSGGAAMSDSWLGAGHLVNVQFERRSSAFSIGATAEFATRDFTTAGSSPVDARPAATLQVFAGVPLSFGSIGASYIWRDMRDEPDIGIVSANASIRLSRRVTLHVAGRQSLGSSRETAVEMFVTLPLGMGAYASGGLAVRDGGPSMTANLQRNLPPGVGIGYRLAADVGRYDRLEGRLDVQTDFGTYGATLSWTDSGSGIRMVASGSIGIVGGQVFASRTLTQSFAAVRVGNFPNVRVYADNQLVGRTNRHGVVIVPRLRPFERNRLSIEIADLPMDTRLTYHDRSVRPPNRSGVNVDFGATRSRSAVVNVRLENGQPLPSGATLSLQGSSEDFLSAPGGDVYLDGLRERNVVVAHFEGSTCQFPLDLRESADPQPQLGRVICRTARP